MSTISIRCWSVVELNFRQKKARHCLAFNLFIFYNIKLKQIVVNYNKLDKIVFNVALGRMAFSAKSASAR